MKLPGISVPGVDSDDWYTPPYIFDALQVTFDVDVCAPPGGVPWIPAARYYTEEQDGLESPWDGSIWLNPPYSEPGPWVRRMANSEEVFGMALVPADTASSWWQYVTTADSVCFLRHRVTFIREGNNNVTSARFPSAIAAWGMTFDFALRESGLGWCVRTLR